MGIARHIVCRLQQFLIAAQANRLKLRDIAIKAACSIAGESAVNADTNWGTGCTDMGDLSAVMPAVHPYAGGASGTGHGADYAISDPYAACVRSAQLQLSMLAMLLSDDADQAKRVLANSKPRFANVQEYFKVMDDFELDRELVRYDADGNVLLQLAK